VKVLSELLEAKNTLVLREILSFGKDFFLSFPNGNNLKNESNTLMIISKRKMRHQFESIPLVLRLLFLSAGCLSCKNMLYRPTKMKTSSGVKSIQGQKSHLYYVFFSFDLGRFLSA